MDSRSCIHNYSMQSTRQCTPYINQSVLSRSSDWVVKIPPDPLMLFLDGRLNSFQVLHDCLRQNSNTIIKHHSFCEKNKNSTKLRNELSWWFRSTLTLHSRLNIYTSKQGYTVECAVFPQQECFPNIDLLIRNDLVTAEGRTGAAGCSIIAWRAFNSWHLSRTPAF